MAQTWQLKISWNQANKYASGMIAYENLKGELYDVKVRAKQIYDAKASQGYTASICWIGITTKEEGCYEALPPPSTKCAGGCSPGKECVSGWCINKCPPGYMRDVDGLCQPPQVPRIFKSQQPNAPVSVAPSVPKPRVAWLPKGFSAAVTAVEIEPTPIVPATVRGPETLGGKLFPWEVVLYNVVDGNGKLLLATEAFFAATDNPIQVDEEKSYAKVLWLKHFQPLSDKGKGKVYYQLVKHGPHDEGPLTPESRYYYGVAMYDGEQFSPQVPGVSYVMQKPVQTKCPPGTVFSPKRQQCMGCGTGYEWNEPINNCVQTKKMSKPRPTYKASTPLGPMSAVRGAPEPILALPEGTVPRPKAGEGTSTLGRGVGTLGLGVGESPAPVGWPPGMPWPPPNPFPICGAPGAPPAPLCWPADMPWPPTGFPEQPPPGWPTALVPWPPPPPLGWPAGVPWPPLPAPPAPSAPQVTPPAPAPAPAPAPVPAPGGGAPPAPMPAPSESSGPSWPLIIGLGALGVGAFALFVSSSSKGGGLAAAGPMLGNPNKPRPIDGYAYATEKGNWRGTSDENWDTVLITPDQRTYRYVGTRHIDGSLMNVWRELTREGDDEGRYVAQLAHMTFA